MANTSNASRTSEATGKIAEGAKDLAHQATDKAKDLAHQAAEKADQGAATVGTGLKTVADKIRENAPESGYLGSAARTVSDTLASGGRYLEREKLSGMAEDVGETIRNHPVPALFIAAGLGFLLGLAMARR
jgi:ElaB/YqjD/DUF883 family membrane-anchored ribosome-binding protein